ncbi:hypothetical protein E2C01_095149 [Portunus trituberculatus]|uniref:Uncharacterized protein n=1 Tax=Portunus trituberculatus TaxID=210409 RepID=A0A5B7JY12_PORTR|nr:hypothetical protein [Portunus trituberculatus]
MKRQNEKQQSYLPCLLEVTRQGWRSSSDHSHYYNNMRIHMNTQATLTKTFQSVLKIEKPLGKFAVSTNIHNLTSPNLTPFPIG